MGKFNTIADYAWKLNLKIVPFGSNGFDLNSFAWWLRRRGNWFRREVERNSKDIGVFRVEEIFFIQIVGLSAECATDHLLAKQLGPERSNSEDVSDGVCIPSFCEHRDGNNASNRATELTGFANSVHHFAK